MKAAHLAQVFMQSTSRDKHQTAVMKSLWSAFTMKQAMLSRRTSRRAISKRR